ncbi:LacI family DNA-binding transcriptional regulator [Miniimonas sp. S16]|uniref:LacI family DNA-binding transcriptional regulator n=1 Tax=Miniimonas sp. S16 TaxID=2171623 RepID=UPI00131ED6B0|nr:LacI family DNA-binding transcriptional regulator [Miniimonas sp. S16]
MSGGVPGSGEPSTRRSRRSDPEPAPRALATRVDVARLAGVSSAVVSYVVNDGPRPVAAETRARVLQAMDQLGYVPNASARNLRRGSTQTLGLVVADSQNPFFGQYTFELVKAAERQGKQLLIADSREDAAREADIVDNLVAQQVDGLLFTSAFARVDRSRSLRLAGIPTVLIDCPGPVVGRRTVGSDAGGAAEMLVRHLVEHGRTRIGLVIGHRGFGDPDPREHGWRLALRSAGLPDGPIVRVPFTREGGFAGAQALLESADVDAIFASNDIQGVGALLALQQRGVRVPDDVAVVSFDGTEESRFCWPPLTAARQRIPDLAATALELLGTPDTEAGTHVSLPTDLVRRRSCGCGVAEPDPGVAAELQLPDGEHAGDGGSASAAVAT